MKTSEKLLKSGYEIVPTKLLNTRQNITCFYKKHEAYFIFHKNSRILTKDIDNLQTLLLTLEKLKQDTIQLKRFKTNSSICSKALKEASLQEWRIENATL